MAGLIKARELCRSYIMGRSTVNALTDIQLEVPQGGFAAILGPSGSGKSTLLHLVGGLDRPSSGTIAVAGQALEALDENALASYRRKTVGIIFQSFNLIPGFTALENVAFPLRFNGGQRRQREALARQALESVGLSDRANHRPGELSGGQQQRVAIARALINMPEIILADEPTGNLDTRSGGQIMEILAALNAEGRTVMVVSHDPRISHYATQMLCLLDGRLVDEEQYNQALALAPKESGDQ